MGTSIFLIDFILTALVNDQSNGRNFLSYEVHTLVVVMDTKSK